MRTVLALTVTLAAAAITTASAATLTRYVPQDALMTLEVNDLPGTEQRLGGFAKELRALDLPGLFAELANEPAFKTQNPGDLIAREAVISLHWSPKATEPGVLLVSKPKAGADKAIANMLRRTVDAQKKSKSGTVRQYKEGRYSFYQSEGFAFGYANGVAYASSDANLLRGFLRRLGGGKEPGLSQSAAYASTMNTVGNGVIRAYLNFDAAGNTASALLSKTDFSREAREVVASLRTLGQFGANLAVTANGLESSSVLTPNPKGSDKALYNLLLLPPQPLVSAAALPASAETFGFGRMDLPAFVRYMDTWFTKLGGRGTPGLTEMARQNLGIDLQSALLGWVGQEYAVVTFPQAAGAPRKSSSATDPFADLQGFAFYLSAKNPAAASSGLDSLFGKLIEMTAGEEDAPKLRSLTVAGVPAKALETEDFGIFYAIKGNYVTFTFSEADLGKALADGPRLADSAAFRNAIARFPKSVQALQYGGAPMLQTREAIRQQLTLALSSAGDNLTGAQQTRLINRFTTFIDAFQRRLGSQAGYTTVENGKLVTRSYQNINWK
ncbi:hypothetical protein HNR42_001822 [Deinobacterium chartae]|uniref:DUF3352 domain-containing protein n=1 Tax=Deinobacterium chartae TaxID=521158 RepID=A0A841I229_9DEIO|nr:DUF3352 domain-containing protein [Deinobacterium chartae]MBB6098388.1 hypothetical protein [Deinobacterium chartae]